jgi:hypothetical protein
VHLFEGNKAATKTLIPVLTQFRERHPDAGEVIVVADAGMLSTCSPCRRRGCPSFVDSKVSKAAYDLAEHLERHGNAFDDSQPIQTTRRMGTGKDARTGRVVWPWRFKRYQHGNRAINAIIDRNEPSPTGTNR